VFSLYVCGSPEGDNPNPIVKPDAGSRVSDILAGQMKPFHIPRVFVILFLFVVFGTFLAGSLHAFRIASAAPGVTPTATARHLTETEVEPTPQPVANVTQISADTTGIIALAIVIVIIVLVGAIMGGSRPHKNTPN